MLDDILKLVVELTNTITEELNNSEKIASLMVKFERRGFQAGIDVHPFVRTLTSESAPVTGTEENSGEKPTSKLQFTDFDIGFLKAMRIVDSEPASGEAKEDGEEGQDPPP